jgi:hypothetical protein
MLATTGLSISKHYCGSSLVRTSLGTEAKSCMPDMDMGHGCCDEKTETLVIDDDFQLTKSNFKIAPEYDLLVAYLVNELVAVPERSNLQSLTFFDTGPPVAAEPVYLKAQSFLL